LNTKMFWLGLCMCFIVLCIVLEFNLHYLNKQYVYLLYYNHDDILGSMHDFKVNGFYSPGEYYCVWTKGRKDWEIADTKNHEICHALVYSDHEHFCEVVHV
jgi:hypothetical protein